jgi:hypothetical protein
VAFLIFIIGLILSCEFLSHNNRCPCQLTYYLTIQNPTSDSVKAIFDFSQATYPADYFIDTATITSHSTINDSINYSLLGIDGKCMLDASFNKLNTRIKLIIVHHTDSVHYELFPFDTIHYTEFPCNCTSKDSDTVVVK